MLYEILVRATDLLQEISTITGSGKYTVGEDIPETQQDFEGYVAWWGDASWTQERLNDTQNRFIVTMAGYLQSPQAGTGQRFTTRKFMMQYADLITQKFIERPRLESSTGVPLNGVINENTGFTAGSIRVVPYPDNQSQIIRYRYTFTLNIHLLRSKVC